MCWKWLQFHLHLADASIQSGLQCIQVIHFLSVYVFPGNWTHTLLCCWRNALTTEPQEHSSLWWSLFRIRREIHIFFLLSIPLLLVITICCILDADVLVTWQCLPARFCLVSKLHQNNPADSPARRDANSFFNTSNSDSFWMILVP